MSQRHPSGISDFLSEAFDWMVEKNPMTGMTNISVLLLVLGCIITIAFVIGFIYELP